MHPILLTIPKFSLTVLLITFTISETLLFCIILYIGKRKLKPFQKFFSDFIFFTFFIIIILLINYFKGPITIRTYGILLGIGFLSSLYVASFLTKDVRSNQNFIYDLAIWVIAGSIIGARAYYVLMDISTFKAEPLEIFKIWHGGLVFYGGLFGGIIGAFLYSFIKKINFFEIADIGAVVIPLGHAFGRIGCFFNGCCYGHIIQGKKIPWWAIINTDPASAGPVGFPLFPSQLISSFINFMIFVFLLYMFKKRRFFNGIILSMYMISYGIARFFIEFTRNDYLDFGSVINFYGIIITFAQITAIFVILIGIIILISLYLLNKRRGIGVRK